MSVFKGKNYRYGIHVPDMKYLSSGLPIESMPMPKKAFICLSQHIGAPAIPIVSVGDVVKKGQLIAKENGFISANVYSSISGKVVAIEDKINGLNQKHKYIVIENDGSQEQLLFDDLSDFEPSTLIERIRLAGVVGMGGAGFPTAVKLSPKTKVDTLIINGAECEPYLTCDHRLMIERAYDIYKGIKYTAKILGVTKVIVGIEANKPDAIKIFSEFKDIDVCILKKQYPMGSEKHLIYCATGRKVPLGKLPLDVGVCVQNIKTMIACYEAIELNHPLTDIILTISGMGVDSPKNLRVAIGTPFYEIAEFCGINTDATIKAVAGGPMMGKAIFSFNHYAKKTDSGFVLLSSKETDVRQPSNCINCARCAKNCPMRLMPMYIEFYANAGDYKKAEKYGTMNCIECGSCAFNCPAKRPLVASITSAKAKIKEMRNNEK